MLEGRTDGNPVPSVKFGSHIPSRHRLASVSFYLECLLYALPDSLFRGSVATSIASILHAIASRSADSWYNGRSIRTPCLDRRLFSRTEWNWESWKTFHDLVVFFDLLAQAACHSPDKAMAIQTWQLLLGRDFFPTQV